MSEKENVDLIKRAYDRFRQGDIHAMLEEMLTQNVEWNIPEMRDVPFSGKKNGLDGVKKFFDTLAEKENVERMDVNEIISQDDKVVTIGEYAATVKATNRRYETYFVHLFTFENGKVARFDEYVDTEAIIKGFQKSQTALT